MAVAFSLSVAGDLPGSRTTSKKANIFFHWEVHPVGCISPESMQGLHSRGFSNQGCFLDFYDIGLGLSTILGGQTYKFVWGATAPSSSEKLSLPTKSFPTTRESGSGNQCFAGHSKAFISYTPLCCKWRAKPEKASD